MLMLRRTALVACLVSCSQSPDSGNDAGDASVAEASSDVAAADASDAGSADVVAVMPYAGEVALLESTTDAGAAVFGAQAAFFTTLDAGALATCTTQVGNCCYYTAVDGGALGTPVGAGSITIKYASKTIGTMTPSGTTYAPLTSATTPSFVWVPGDVVDVSGAGDTVHSFFGAVTTATPFAGITPTFAATTLVSRAQDFTISWTASSGAIRVGLLQSSSGDLIVCTTPNDTGSVTVDKSLLASFANGPGTIEILRTNVVDGASDNAAVTVAASASATNATTYTN
jgi:hypothetical protein